MMEPMFMNTLVMVFKVKVKDQQGQTYNSI